MVNGTEPPRLPGRTTPGAPICADASRPDGAAALITRLAAVEAGIRADRHRLPAAVVEDIARLWAAGATVSGVSARTGISREIVRDRLHRVGALEYLFRNRHRHMQEVLEQRGADLIAAYEAGTTMTALAADAGVSLFTMRTYLIVHGIAIRDRRRADLRPGSRLG